MSNLLTASVAKYGPFKDVVVFITVIDGVQVITEVRDQRGHDASVSPAEDANLLWYCGYAGLIEEAEQL